ncbi:hypothetical protein JTE90_011418 [Oedothorax gibbosus]|uniref:Chitin-binding type-2 domain-containing protein n=1 Tax=Oedothorax gibbosus TaxID=931172 RepID=A0AAV6VAX9_9ARAC|nr:hypothetical protein JTE90_011418 [Oedothorax gibbosus]
MRLMLLASLLFATLVVCCCTEQRNATKPARKTLRTVKALKKSTANKKSKKTATEPDKSETYHVPLIVSAPKGVPVSVEVHDDDTHIRGSPDIRPIRPIHLVPLHDKPRQQEAQPRRYDEDREVFKGPVAVPREDNYGHHTEGIERSFYDSDRKQVAPGEFYSENLHLYHEPEVYHEDFSAIPGLPGIDYPTLSQMPHTGFKCLMHTATPGFYADVETKCQMWHYCQPDGRHDRFLCPNGTIFDQSTRVCNWWFNVHCESSLDRYDVNFDLYREPVKVEQATHYVDTPSIPASYHLDTPSVPSSYLESPISVPNPNSFLRHVAEFEATRHANPDHPQGILEASQPVQSIVHGLSENEYQHPKTVFIDSHHIDEGRHRYGHRGTLIDPVDQYTKVSSGHQDGSHHYVRAASLVDSDHRVKIGERYPGAGKHESGIKDDHHHHSALIDSSHHIDIGQRYPIVSDTNGNSHHYVYGNSKIPETIHHVDDGYIRPIHHQKRYPAKMAPSPLVRHDSIDYDSSVAHSSLSSPADPHTKSEAKKNPNETTEQRTPLKKRKRIPRRRLRKNHLRRKTTKSVAIEPSTVLPTYREANVTPAGRRYRIVRKRKDNKP